MNRAQTPAWLDRALDEGGMITLQSPITGVYEGAIRIEQMGAEHTTVGWIQFNADTEVIADQILTKADAAKRIEALIDGRPA